jgi:hypothetical protein
MKRKGIIRRIGERKRHVSKLIENRQKKKKSLLLYKMALKAKHIISVLET